jgi:hypothetical protein
MPSIIRATTTSGLQVAPDNSGSLQLQTNGTTAAVTVDTSQNTTFAGKVTSAGALTLASNGTTTAVTIDTSQNVGIGVTPVASTRKLLQINDSAVSYVGNMAGGTSLTQGSYFSSGANYYGVTGSPVAQLTVAGGVFYFDQAPSGTSGNTATLNSAMRIDSGGAVNINRTSGGGKLNVTGDLWLYAITAGAGNSTLKYNSGTGQVTYDASSRYYKENIQDLEYGLSSVMAMKPRKYVYKATGVIDIGFIADEMLPLVPEITPLANNSINDMGVPDGEPFTVNYDRLTAVLVKAIQEQQTIINDLKARVEALEAK